MSNIEMKVEFFGSEVAAKTEGSLICLNDLFNAGNAHRLANGRPALQMASFLRGKTVEDYVKAASDVWGLPESTFIQREGRGKNTRTYVHVSVAVLAGEQISPEFHATVHKVFVEGKLLELRALGATEFRSLNSAIDSHLTGRIGKDNRGVFIQVAKQIRNALLGRDAKTKDWNSATPEQTRLRYDWEHRLVDMLQLGVIQDYDHLKSVISAMASKRLTTPDFLSDTALVGVVNEEEAEYLVD
jgi:hypothetical protein